MKDNDCPQIVRLKGPDRVRKRPAVIFGSDDIEGSISAVKILMDVFITEAVFGFSTGINLTIHEDNAVSIHSFDRGMILDDTIVNGKPSWYYHFCELYCGPQTPNDNYLGFLDDCHTELFGETPETSTKYQPEFAFGLDLCCVQYVTQYMHVEATRDGIRKTLDFERGYCISDLNKKRVKDSTGTYIHFKLDREVFKSIEIPTMVLSNFLEETAATIPDMRFELKDERNGLHFTYHYPCGLEDYMSERVPLSIPLFTSEVEATGKDRYNRREYNAKVRVLFSFVSNSSEMRCFHNFRVLKYGGHHLREVKKKIVKYINWVFISDFVDILSPKKAVTSREDLEITVDDIENNIVLFIETKCSKNASNYENATRQSITNKMIVDMATDLINQDFGHYLKQNHDLILPVLKDIQWKKRKSMK